MSGHEFTPGPWGALKTETGPWAVFNVGGNWVATTSRRQWPTEDRANVRLMAAAPDLLEACETFAAWLDHEENGFTITAGLDRGTPEGEAVWREWWGRGQDLCRRAQDQARAAIAKATGEPT